MTINDQAFEIIPLTLAEIRADESGRAIGQLAELIEEVFSEPPWNEYFSASRIHFGLGVELMRKHAMLYVAKTKHSGAIIGYVLGKEIFRKSNDERDQTLSWISGMNALDDLFDGRKRIFYVSGLAVRREFRRCGIAERLSLALNADLRQRGFDYRLGRTDRTALPMRQLYTKLGFRELPITDANFQNRTYWLLAL